MSQQHRRPEPRKFLDASLVPLEQALLVRAQAIVAEVLNTPDLPCDADAKEVVKASIIPIIRSLIAEEFRVLAEELHHW